MAYDYHDHAAESPDGNSPKRIHAEWVDEPFGYVTVDDGMPTVSSEWSTKPWVGNPNCVFDDNSSTFVRYCNEYATGSDPVKLTFRCVNNTDWNLGYVLYLRLKASIITGGYGNLGHFQVEYTRTDGTVVTPLSNCKSYDGCLLIADNVTEIRLIAIGEIYGGSYYVYFDFYTMRPYSVTPSNVQGKAADGRIITFCRARTFDGSEINDSLRCWPEAVVARTSHGEESLMAVAPNHPFASSFKVRTINGELALVEYR